MTLVWSIIGFVIVMGLIVTIHEWGHYQVAKWFNIKVTDFSIGFGKSLYEKQGRETCFKICLIPLGGYVKFADEREGPVAASDLSRAFNRQSVYKRFAVVAAGPIINLIFAWFAFVLMYMVGISGFKPVFNEAIHSTPLASALPQSFAQNEQAWSVTKVDGEDVYNWQSVHQSLLKSLVDQQPTVDITIESVLGSEELFLSGVSITALDLNQPDQNWLTQLGFKPFQPLLQPVLGEIVKDASADRAGLRPEDVILSIDSVRIEYWQDLVKVVQANPNQTLPVVYQREGVSYTVPVTLESVELADQKVAGRMGVGVKQTPELMAPYITTYQLSFFEAVSQSYYRSVDLVQMSLSMLKSMLFGEVGLHNLSGPLSIAQFSGQAVQSGLVTFLSLLGLLSLSIGILNLLPIPVLDGGHLVYYLIEMVKGSPVSEQIIEVGQRIGIVLILGLTFVALFNDVLRISNG